MYFCLITVRNLLGRLLVVPMPVITVRFVQVVLDDVQRLFVPWRGVNSGGVLVRRLLQLVSFGVCVAVWL